MFSFDFPFNQTLSHNKDYTIASTFKKTNSILVKLLFGEYREKRIKNASTDDFTHEVDYVFEPGQVFGISIRSSGLEYKKFHYCFVLKACRAGEQGQFLPIVKPGSHVLLKTLTMPSSARFVKILEEFKSKQVEMTSMSESDFIRLSELLDYKLPTDYFLAERCLGK